MDPLWYKDAVIYQLHVRSFFDANNDGYGDFEGLRRKLPYLEELGVNTLWLMPFFQSPLRDDGYDISDYYQILPVHGTLEDFKRFLDEAHGRGMKVIIELVLNHTSIDHPWFQEARKPNSPMRDWYVWSDTPEKYKGVRVIFKDFETSNWTFDPVAKAYYWHRFYWHQPDLNWDNPEVEKAIHQVMFFWADLGVDGFRLDAIPYLYEREGTSCENLPETIEAVKRLRKALEERYGPGKILLAEANMWPEETLPYFGDGDGVHMAYNFPLMPRIFMALRREDRGPIETMLKETEGIPETAQWALFLRNHDELTLEKVTEEEREFMYEAYAPDPKFRINLGIRRRLMPLLGGDRRRYELLTALLLTLKGTPIVYYGDEIGMGDNPFLGDRNGVRTPMQWSQDRNAGFSRAPYHALFLPPVSEGPYSYHFVNVEAQRENPHSLLSFNRRFLALRNQHAKIFGRGSLTLLPVENRRVLAYLREHEGERVLVVANLSRYTQAFDLPLEAYQGLVPVELFSQQPFPPVEGRYRLTLGPHGFALFALKPVEAVLHLPSPDWAEEPAPEEADLPRVHMPGGPEVLLVDTLVHERGREELLNALAQTLKEKSWLALKPQKVALLDALRFQKDPPLYLTLLQLENHRTLQVFLPSSGPPRGGKAPASSPAPTASPATSTSSPWTRASTASSSPASRRGLRGGASGPTTAAATRAPCPRPWTSSGRDSRRGRGSGSSSASSKTGAWTARSGSSPAWTSPGSSGPKGASSGSGAPPEGSSPSREASPRAAPRTSSPPWRSGSWKAFPASGGTPPGPQASFPGPCTRPKPWSASSGCASPSSTGPLGRWRGWRGPPPPRPRPRGLPGAGGGGVPRGPGRGKAGHGGGGPGPPGLRRGAGRAPRPRGPGGGALGLCRGGGRLPPRRLPPSLPLRPPRGGPGGGGLDAAHGRGGGGAPPPGGKARPQAHPRALAGQGRKSLGAR